MSGSDCRLYRRSGPVWYSSGFLSGIRPAPAGIPVLCMSGSPERPSCRGFPPALVTPVCSAGIVVCVFTNFLYRRRGLGLPASAGTLPPFSEAGRICPGLRPGEVKKHSASVAAAECLVCYGIICVICGRCGRCPTGSRRRAVSSGRKGKPLRGWRC